jgi:hypothetical protein
VALPTESEGKFVLFIAHVFDDVPIPWIERSVLLALQSEDDGPPPGDSDTLGSGRYQVGVDRASHQHLFDHHTTGLAGKPLPYSIIPERSIGLADHHTRVNARIVDTTRECGRDGAVGLDALRACALVISTTDVAIRCGTWFGVKWTRPKR